MLIVAALHRTCEIESERLLILRMARLFSYVASYPVFDCGNERGEKPPKKS